MKGLVEIDKTVRLTSAGKQALHADNYDRIVSEAALGFLNKCGSTLSSIHHAIESVSLPEVPESKKIFEKLSRPEKHRLGFEKFRMILFPLSCTQRLEREVKVLYGKRKAATP